MRKLVNFCTKVGSTRKGSSRRYSKEGAVTVPFPGITSLGGRSATQCNFES